MNCPVKDETYLCETPCMIDKCPYQQGRADEQIQSIEDAKKQAAEYLDALDKAKKEAYQQGARKFAEWLLVNHTLDCIECNCGDKSIGCKECANEYITEWQKKTEE